MIKLTGKRKWFVLLCFALLVVSFGTYLGGETWECNDLQCEGGENCISDSAPEEIFPCMFACYFGINKTYMFCQEPPRK
jgi:hypothetical protein